MDHSVIITNFRQVGRVLLQRFCKYYTPPNPSPVLFSIANVVLPSHGIEHGTESNIHNHTQYFSNCFTLYVQYCICLYSNDHKEYWQVLKQTLPTRTPIVVNWHGV